MSLDLNTHTQKILVFEVCNSFQTMAQNIPLKLESESASENNINTLYDLFWGTEDNISLSLMEKYLSRAIVFMVKNTNELNQYDYSEGCYCWRCERNDLLHFCVNILEYCQNIENNKDIKFKSEIDEWTNYLKTKNVLV